MLFQQCPKFSQPALSQFSSEVHQPHLTLWEHTVNSTQNSTLKSEKNTLCNTIQSTIFTPLVLPKYGQRCFGGQYNLTMALTSTQTTTVQEFIKRQHSKSLCSSSVKYTSLLPFTALEIAILTSLHNNLQPGTVTPIDTHLFSIAEDYTNLFELRIGSFKAANFNLLHSGKI